MFEKQNHQSNVLVFDYQIDGIDMSNAFSDPQRSFPASIPEFVGHQATYAAWQQHLADSPVIAMQPNWQAIEANDDPELAVWGLHSITLHTSVSDIGDEWPGGWPDALPAAQSTLVHANSCFGEPLLYAHNIALYQIQSPLGLSWVVQCMFSDLGALQHLTLIRMHDWQALAEKYPEPSSVDHPQAPAPAAPVGLSAAGSLAPATGWYEAILPYGHPMQAFVAGSDIRLVFREKAERFPTLGVSPSSDEALVQWAWLRAD